MTLAKPSRRSSRFGHKRFDGPANLAKRLVNVRGMLPRIVDDFNGIPDDVILAHCLEPECLNADRSAADFAIPEKESWSEGFAVDLRPSGRVNEKAEQILLSAIEPSRAVHALLRRLKVDREFAKHRHKSAS